MKLSNSLYDILKYIGLIVCPAVATLWLTLGGIWGFPYTEAIGATITAIGVFIGAIIGISAKNYNKKNK